MKSYGLAVCRLAVGIFHASCGLQKLREPREFYEIPLNAYALLSRPMNHSLTAIMPLIELLLGVCLVLGVRLRLSIILLLAFVIAQEAILTVAIVLRRTYPINGLIAGPFAAQSTGAALLACMIIGLILLALSKEERHVWTLERFLDD